MMPLDYHVASGIALIVIGAALVCGALISQRRAQTDPPEPDDVGELRAFIDSLPETDQAARPKVRPRLDQIRNEPEAE